MSADTKPSTPQHRSPGGKRRNKRQRSTIFLKQDEKGPQSVRRTLEMIFLNKDGELPERRGRAHMGYSERIDTILN